MYTMSQKLISLVVVVSFSLLFFCGEGYAAAPTIDLGISPNVPEVYVGSNPITITAQTTGKQLTYRWELTGPGKIEGSGPAVFYIVPEQIDRATIQVVVTCIVTDKIGQETTKSVVFNLRARQTQPQTPVVAKPPSEGMSTTTKIALGIGAAAALGTGIVLLAGSGDDEKSGPFSGRFTRSYVTYTNDGTPVDATDTLNLRQDGNLLSGTREMMRTLRGCCILNLFVSASGIVHGTVATLTYAAGETRCDGIGGCWLTMRYSGGTFEYTLINNRILHPTGTTDADFFKQSVMTGHSSPGERDEPIFSPEAGDFVRQ